MNTDCSNSIKWRVTFAAIVTLLYWYWESKASGNLRVDLLLLYPLLAVFYTIVFWPKFRFYAVGIALLMMIVNVLFFIISYDLFNKNPG